MGEPKKSRDYTIVIIAMCFLMEFVCLGFASSNKSLYLTAITEALGIKRSLFSINDSLRYLTTAAINLFFGSLVQKLGVRKMLGIGFASLIGSMLSYACANEILGFYLGGVLLGLGLAFTTTTMISYIIRRWCKQNTGTILGFVLAANGIGSALAAQIVTPIIFEEGNPFGYRNAYFLIAAILAVVGIISLLLYREHNDAQDAPAAKKKGRGSIWSGMEFSFAKTRPYFYMTLVGIFFTGMVLQGVYGITATHYMDVGIDKATVATVLSVFSLMLTASKFLAGFSYDRLGLRITLIICETAAILMNVLLLVVSNSSTGVAIAMSISIISAIAMPLETIMLSLITGDIFGSRSFDKMLGLVSAANTAGYAAGAPLMNLCYDMLGSYKPIIAAAGALMVIVLVMFQVILRLAGKDREKILAEEAANAK